MRPYVLALSILVLATPAVAADRGLLPAAPAACLSAKATRTQSPTGEVKPLQRLDQLPQAVLELAVMKSVAGCPVSVRRMGNRTYETPIETYVRRITPLGATPRTR